MERHRATGLGQKADSPGWEVVRAYESNWMRHPRAPWTASPIVLAECPEPFSCWWVLRRVLPPLHHLKHAGSGFGRAHARTAGRKLDRSSTLERPAIKPEDLDLPLHHALNN